MSPDQNVADLSKKHRSLELRIVEEMSRPAYDYTKVSALKFQKLGLKDKIVKFSPSSQE